MAPDIESLLNRPEQIFIPLDLQIRMKSALHQDAGSTEIECFLDLAENDVLREDVAFLVPKRPVKRAEAAVLGTEIRVINVAIDNVRSDSFRVEFPPDRVGLHADADQIIAPEEVDRFL